MADDVSKLAEAARQLIEAEMQIGGDFLPRRRNPLPQPAAVANADAPCEEASAAPSLAALPPMTAQQKCQALEDLNAKCVQQCRACILAGQRSTVVFGEGNADARLVFVGEGPGEEEDRTGRPFVGRAGELLTKMIAAMGLRREDVYIANMVKCRPPGNRTPEPAEVAACMPFLLRQLQIIAPKVIVTLGNPATQNLLKTTIGITKLRGQWQKLPNLAEGLEGIPVMPTFHPAYVLRNYNETTRSLVWSDLQKVMAVLGLKKAK